MKSIFRASLLLAAIAGSAQAASTIDNVNRFAHGANIGWMDCRADGANGVVIGEFVCSGFIYAANVGWISLSNALAFVQTDTIRPGADTDGDGIADAWELLHFGDLTIANSKSDFDHDGFTDLQEYLADTDPKDPSSNLRLTRYSFAANGSPVTLTWNSRPTRGYRVLKRANLDAGFPWTDVGLGLFAPDADATTTRVFADPTPLPRFFEIEAFRPLAP